MSLTAFSHNVFDSIPDDQKLGIDPITGYNIIVMACKAIVACASMPLMEACQSSYDATSRSFADSTALPTAMQLRIAARQNGTRLSPSTARQWAHALLLQSLNTPAATLTTLCSESQNNG